MEEHTKDIDEHHGIWVDIMPFDVVPLNQLERKKHARQISFWEQMFIAKTVWKASAFHGENKKWILTCVRTFLHILLLPVPRRVLFNKLDQVCRKFNGLPTGMYAFRGDVISECFEEDLLPVEKAPFENLIISVPRNCDKVLKTNYGDNMKLPPVEKRVGHLPYRLKF